MIRLEARLQPRTIFRHQHGANSGRSRSIPSKVIHSGAMTVHENVPMTPAEFKSLLSLIVEVLTLASQVHDVTGPPSVL